jgi:hypothetical protein
MLKVIKKLKNTRLNAPARVFLKKLRRNVVENSADLHRNMYKVYALMAIIVYKAVKCDSIDKLNKMSKVLDNISKNKLERLGVKKTLILEVISKRIEHIKNKRQYHKLMEKITTHTKFVNKSHDLAVLVDFLRENSNDLNALKKMSKYISDLRAFEFEKKFLSNVIMTKDDIKYLINSRINNKDDKKSDDLMKKLKALVYSHNGNDIKEIRKLYRNLKNRDFKSSRLSSELKDIDNLSTSRFEDKFTDSINFNQKELIKAMEHKIHRIQRLRNHSKK